MIILFTDFGLEGPYTGQVKAVLHAAAPHQPVIDLFADAPMQRPQEAAYLLAAYAAGFPPGSVFLCVVDPGVGGERPAVALKADGRWFVGPGNGLFEPLMRRAAQAEEFRILPPAGQISASFHGRDVFAPVAGRLPAGADPVAAGLATAALPRQPAWPDDLPAVVYIDRYGNVMTGLRAATLPADARLAAGHRLLCRARTFSAVTPGAAFWYENSNGLAELAVNQGRADIALGLTVGSAIAIVS